MHINLCCNNVGNIPSFVPKAAFVPTCSRNRPTSVPAGSRNRPTFVPTGSRNRPTSIPPGLAIITKCIWMREDGGLLLEGAHQQVFSWESKANIEIASNPRTMVEISSIYMNKVLFTDKECLVLSKEFQLPEDSQVVLRVPRRHNLYTFNLTEIQPERDINCLLARASSIESTKWHRRMAHVNFKNINKLAKHGLVNGLPSKLFTNDHNCLPMQQGKQHIAFLQGHNLTCREYHSFCPLRVSSHGPFLVLLPSEALITSTTPWWLQMTLAGLLGFSF
ncbi:putative ribonuclease H-like domain-containing protein [Tanacetum coccineum]